MYRKIIIFLFCASLVCCQKTSPSIGVVEQSFDIAKGNEEGFSAIRSLTYESKAWGDAKAASEEQGWKAVRAKEEPIPASISFKNSDEELDFYGGAIFQSLGYPLQDTPGSGLSMTTNQTVVIRHRKEALAQFNELLERWRLSPSERFNDMLNGRK